MVHCKLPHKFRLIGISVFLSTLTPVLGGVALAQSAGVLDEVIVTAERRETTLQDTPVSVLVLSTESLEQAGITNTQELQNVSPSLIAAGNRGSGDGNLNLAIRGVGQRSSRVNGERGVGLYLDGIYYPDTDGSNLTYVDLDRIEVLRGPQGTLFGRNNTGGAVRYFTKRPDLDASYASVELTAGDYSRLDGTIIGNLSVSETLALRGVYAHSEADGFMDWVDASGMDTGREPLGSQDNDMYRVGLRYVPSDRVRIDAGVTYTEHNDTGAVTDTIGLGSGTAGFIGEVNQALLNETGTGLAASDDPRVLTDSFYTNIDACLLDEDGLIQSRVATANPANPFDYCDTPRSTETLTSYLDINWDLANGLSLQSLTGYNDVQSDSKYDWSTYGTYMRVEENHTKSWSQEFQLSGTALSDRVTWVTGVTYFHFDGYNAVEVWQSNTRSAAYFDVVPAQTERMESDTDSWGVYGQANWMISDQLGLTAGLRYSNDDKSHMTFRSNYLDGYRVTAADTWSDTNFRIVLDYNWSEDVMTYISISDAFKAGGFPQRANASFCDPAVAGDPTLCDSEEDLILNGGIVAQTPEKVLNYELGLRSQFLGRMRLNLTAFMMEYTDLQRGQRRDDPTDPDCNNVFDDGNCTAIFLSGNVGEVELKGMESEFLYAFNDAFTLTINAAYVDSEIIDNSGSQDLVVGQPIEQSPKFNYSVGLEYNTDLSSGAAVNAAVTYMEKDKYIPPFGLTDEFVGGYNTMSARVQYTAPNQRWQASIGGTNLTNETITYGLNHWGGFFGGLVQEVRGAPRMYYLRLKYNFGGSY